MLDLNISLRPPSHTFPYVDGHQHQHQRHYHCHQQLQQQQQQQQHHHHHHKHPPPDRPYHNNSSPADHITRLQRQDLLGISLCTKSDDRNVLGGEIHLESSSPLPSDLKLSCSESMVQRRCLNYSNISYKTTLNTMTGENTGRLANQINVKAEGDQISSSSISTAKPYISSEITTVMALQCNNSIAVSSSPSCDNNNTNNDSCINGNNFTQADRSISKSCAADKYCVKDSRNGEDQVISLENSYDNNQQELEASMQMRDSSVHDDQRYLRMCSNEGNLNEQEKNTSGMYNDCAFVKHSSCASAKDTTRVMLQCDRIKLQEEQGEEALDAEEENSFNKLQESINADSRLRTSLYSGNKEEEEKKMIELIDEEHEEEVVEETEKDEQDDDDDDDEDPSMHGGMMIRELFPLKPESSVSSSIRCAEAKIHVDTDDEEMGHIVDAFHTEEKESSSPMDMTANNTSYDWHFINNNGVNTPQFPINNSYIKMSSKLRSSTMEPAELAGTGISNNNGNNDGDVNNNNNNNINYNSNTITVSTVRSPSLVLMPWFNSGCLRTHFTDNHNSSYISYNANKSCSLGVQVYPQNNTNISSSPFPVSQTVNCPTNVVITTTPTVNNNNNNSNMNMASSAAELAAAIAMSNANNNGSNNSSIIVQRSKKSRRGPRSRSSQYRGVTFYRRTGRWESHIWDTGKQVYLGGFDTSHAAARAYDRAAIKFRGLDADINFQVADYEDEIKHMGNVSKEEFVRLLRRRSIGFPRGSKRFRGNMTLHKYGRWDPLGIEHLFNGNTAENSFPERDRSIYTSTVPTAHALSNGSEHQSLDLGLRMEPLIRSQRSQPEANNSLRASTVMQLSSSDPIEMKDQTPWSVFKINNSVDKIFTDGRRSSPNDASSRQVSPFVRRFNGVEPPLEASSRSWVQWQGHPNNLMSSSPSPSPSPSSSSSPPHAFTPSTSASSSSSQQSSIMQYNTGPHIAASSGFSQGNYNSKAIHDQFKAQQQWLNQCTHNSIHRTGVTRSGSCLSSITTSKQINSNNNIPAHSGNGLLASWNLDMDRNRL